MGDIFIATVLVTAPIGSSEHPFGNDANLGEHTLDLIVKFLVFLLATWLVENDGLSTLLILYLIKHLNHLFSLLLKALVNIFGDPDR